MNYIAISAGEGVLFFKSSPWDHIYFGTTEQLIVSDMNLLAYVSHSDVSH